MLSMRSAKRLNIFVPKCMLLKLLRRTAAEPSGIAVAAAVALLFPLRLLLVLPPKARRKRLDDSLEVEDKDEEATAGRSQMQRNL